MTWRTVRLGVKFRMNRTLSARHVHQCFRANACVEPHVGLFVVVGPCGCVVGIVVTWALRNSSGVSEGIHHSVVQSGG